MEALSLLGLEALKQGVTFLFDQAKRLLDRRPEVTETKLPQGVFTGELDPSQYDEEELARTESALRAMRAGLFPYIDDAALITPDDRQLTSLVDRLRRLLEVIYRQHITFVTEVNRPDSGVRLRVDIDTDRIAGQAIAIDAGTISQGDVEVQARAREVEAGGSLTGIKADRIGGNSP